MNHKLRITLITKQSKSSKCLTFEFRNQLLDEILQNAAQLLPRTQNPQIYSQIYASFSELCSSTVCIINEDIHRTLIIHSTLILQYQGLNLKQNILLVHVIALHCITRKLLDYQPITSLTSDRDADLPSPVKDSGFSLFIFPHSARLVNNFIEYLPIL